MRNFNRLILVYNKNCYYFRTCKNILVLTGAGVSVSCGIPDFRSANGIYARLHKDFPELPDPTAMFDINFFRSNPAPFYNFAKVSCFFFNLLHRKTFRKYFLVSLSLQYHICLLNFWKNLENF